MANSLISMIKGDSTLIDNTEVLDGQILFNTDDKTILLDDDDEREQYGGKSDTANPNIAYVEEGTTATRGYAKGQYVIVSGILYKALVQINSGTTFVVNTNIEQTTVGTELGRTITQEAYDLLPASEKNKGIWYITNSGDSYHVDNALSTTSTNPVQNKILTTEINKINADLNDSVILDVIIDTTKITANVADYFKKLSNLVYIQFSGSIIASLTAFTPAQLGTINTYKPIQEVLAPVVFATGTTGALMIDTNGIISIIPNGNISSGDSMYCQTFYLLK